MPAQIIVTRMTKAETEQKVTELKAGDVVAVADSEGRANCIVRSKAQVLLSVRGLPTAPGRARPLAMYSAVPDPGRLLM